MSGQKDGFQRWQVGDVRVTSIIEMETTVSCIPENGLIPSATPEGLRRHPWLYPHFVNQADELLFAIAPYHDIYFALVSHRQFDLAEFRDHLVIDGQQDVALLQFADCGRTANETNNGQYLALIRARELELA